MSSKIKDSQTGKDVKNGNLEITRTRLDDSRLSTLFGWVGDAVLYFVGPRKLKSLFESLTINSKYINYLLPKKPGLNYALFFCGLSTLNLTEMR